MDTKKGEKGGAEEKSRAWPRADNQLQKQVLDLCNQAVLYKQLKKGANETTKSLNRGVADLIVLAADTEPLEIILHLPLLCEDKNVPYVYVGKQSDLGRACGVSRNIVAACILHHPESQLQSQINEMKDKVEQLLL
jgi:U4/U6 small nuclear ribonucleoprotein SNU13